MIHHIIPKHEWKARFGSLRGVNSPDNVVELTTEQHVHVHRLLFEMNGDAYDKLAADGLSGHLGKEEAIFQANSIAHKGKKLCLGIKHPSRSEEYRRWLSVEMLGNTRALGSKHSKEVIRGKTTRMIGKKIALGKRWKNLLVTCPHCQKMGGCNTMKRWHFDKCKGKL
jgi:hypothetical protein